MKMDRASLIGWPVILKPTCRAIGEDFYATTGPLKADSAGLEATVAQWLAITTEDAGGVIAAAYARCAINGLNILGSVFIEGLRQTGLTCRELAAVDVRDAMLLSPIYPDLPIIKSSSGPHAANVLRNNTGTFTIYATSKASLSPDRLAMQLNESKYAFRKCVAATLQDGQRSNRDHLVHIPSSAAELEAAFEVFPIGPGCRVDGGGISVCL